MSWMITRAGGLAAILGAAWAVAHGAVTMLANWNLDPLPNTTPLWALGLIGLHALLRRRGGMLGVLGGSLAYLGLAVALVQFIALLLMNGEEEPFWQIHILGLVGSLLIILVALLLLGVAILRSEALPAGWRAVPLTVGILWLPLFGFGEWLGDQISPYRELSLGFLLAGLLWIVLGFVLLVAQREESVSTPGSAPPS